MKILNSNPVISSKVGAFEQLFGPGRGELEQKLSKNSNAREIARGECWSCDLTGTLSVATIQIVRFEGNQPETGKRKPETGIWI